MFKKEYFLDYLNLFFLKIKTSIYLLTENIQNIFRYYSSNNFYKIDLYFIFLYFFQNPFKLSKRFLEKKGEVDIYTYGETPLTTLELICKKCQLSTMDVVFELGCGRGRTCFWIHSFIKCRVIGVDFVPVFIQKANQIKNHFELKNIEFRLEDFLKTDLKSGTVFYLYGICLSDENIRRLIKRFERLPNGIKIITMSYSLLDFTSNKDHFKILDTFEAPFLWGSCRVFIQEKVTCSHEKSLFQ